MMLIRTKMVLISTAAWITVLAGGANAIWAAEEPPESPPLRLDQQGTQASTKLHQLCHDVSNIWLVVSNFGVFGLPRMTNANEYQETCGHEGYISCQFPARGAYDYLFQGALWVGAIVGDDTLVSTGHDGWAIEHELFPGFAADDTIKTYTNNPAAANYDSVLGLADQSYVSICTDTVLTADDNAVSPNHRKPLEISIKQTSHALSFTYAEDFVVFDYEIGNLGLKTLRDVYIGIYLDGDVGPTPQSSTDGSSMAQDDVTGFRQYSADGTKEINAAWLADYDGPQYRNSGSGDGVLVPGVMGVRVVRSPSKELVTTFNWWLSDPDQQRDWGPGRPFPDGLVGTPDGDINKYLIMSGWQNKTLPDSTIDPDQIVAERNNSPIGADDTRFLFSFGPFTISPAEQLPFTLGYFCAENFWQGGGVESNDFTDFDINAQWVQFVFDNPGVDSPSFDYGLDGIPNTLDEGEADGQVDTGDFFYGEDAGADGLPGTGDAGEGNGVLDPGEDTTLRYIIRYIDPNPTDPDETPLDYLESISGEIDWSQSAEAIMASFDRLHLSQEVRYGAENNKLDEGDGVPDFSGPPPPPSPDLKVEKLDDSHLIVKWNDEAERFLDGFIPEQKRRRDFQGYRLYFSRSGVGNDFTPVFDLDIAEVPIYDDELNIIGYQADSLGRNTGFGAVLNSDSDSLDYRYRYVFGPTLSNWPVYVAVTAYDNGYPPANLASLESSIFANSTQVYPTTPTADTANKKVRAVPNPYKITTDYRDQWELGGWETDPQSWTEFDRRMAFTNLPGRCTLRIFTIAGDLVQTLAFEPEEGSDDTTAFWDLISRNGQAVVSGIYLFAVEPAPGISGDTQVGKFVILK